MPDQEQREVGPLDGQIVRGGNGLSEGQGGWQGGVQLRGGVIILLTPTT